MTTTKEKPAELPKAYDPGQVEERLYRLWLQRGYFTPRIDPSKKPFVIIMPPPNVTGELHLGHALVSTLEDIMVRWHRMLGEPTLWLPGTDHAGIATQVVVERELAREGLTRHQLGRERFLERVWQWVDKYGRTIDEQHKRLGASCDWTRRRFTLDPGPSHAVRQTFMNLYNKELLYRGERIINWCPRCATALSDLETEHQDTQGHLYYIRYPLSKGKGNMTVATTRPETLLGDTAVAVNPKDPRYTRLIGKTVRLPILGREIPIIADEAVDTTFGTGAVKVTPAHDPTDFEIGQRQNLPSVKVFHPDGTMTQEAGPYQGMDRYKCRERIVEDLRQAGLLEKIEPHQHAVGHCQRCKTVVEPLLSQQWFVKIQPLAEPALKAVEEGWIRIIPEYSAKVYQNWMRNIRDWCISRQLWWGHRIPAWYCKDCSHMTVAVDDPSTCQSCGSAQLEQDPDVLDTWFSSALWPHSTLGWGWKAKDILPGQERDLSYFYPTSVLETSYDILFFWVARMVMMGLENTGSIPFHTVYLHGLIRDPEGVKMSKTKGNVLDPLSLLDRYGTDALRFSLTVGTTAGTDSRLNEARLEASRNFANKIWNAARFVLRGLAEGPEHLDFLNLPHPTHLEDRWILSRLNRVVQRMNQLLEDYQFGQAEQELHDFIWFEFCDWYIELAKIRLKARSEPSPLLYVAHVLERILRLLHPFMPFITEELWQTLVCYLPKAASVPESVMIAPYPLPDATLLDEGGEVPMEAILGIIRSLRNVRAELKLDPSKAISALIDPGELGGTIASERSAIESLARVEHLEVLAPGQPRPPRRNTMTIVHNKAVVLVPLGDLVNLDAETSRLRHELANCQEARSKLEERLKDQEFLSRAPEEVLSKEQMRLEDLHHRAQRLQEILRQLSG